MSTLRDLYRKLSFKLVPLLKGTKVPLYPNWQNTEIPDEVFPTDVNIALQLESCGLVDVDIEDKSLAKFFYGKLPETFSFGRESYGVPSHYLYNIEESPILGGTQKFKNKNGDLILELKYKGLVTLPGSIYTEGESDKIVSYLTIAPSDITTNNALDFIKECILSYQICSVWPGEGSRNDACMGFTGLLLNAGVSETSTKRIMSFIIQETNDEESEKRNKTIQTTIDKFNNGIKISGIKLLSSLLDSLSIKFILGNIDNRGAEVYEAIENVNAKYCWVEQIASIWDIKYNQSISTEAARLEQANREVTIEAGGRIRSVNPIDAWMRSEGRRVYYTVVYKPGQPETWENNINLWGGWGCVPEEGNVEPVLNLLKFFFAGNEDALHWMMCWLAYPLQNPGFKNNTGVLLYSSHQGVGKSMLGYTMKNIYGSNFAAVNETDITGQFNDILFAKQFLVGNEVTGSSRFRGMDRLKEMITEPIISINRKHQKSIIIENCINILLLSNNIDAIWVNNRDRRFFLWEIEGEPLVQDFYDSYGKWLEKNGAAYFFYYLLNYSMNDYSPKRAAPQTQLKEIVSEATSTFILSFIQKYLREENTLELAPAVTFLEVYRTRTGDTNISIMKVIKALQHLGFPKRVIRVDTWKKTIWILKNTAVWRALPDSKWADYLCDNRELLNMEELNF